MSQENVEIVRQEVAVRPSARRRFRERLFLRLPGIGIALTRAILSLPPTSHLRRRMLRDTYRLVLEALNRGDHEAAFALLRPDFETIPPAERVGFGFDPVYRGREGRLRYHRRWVADVGNFRQEAKELIDLGDRVLLLALMNGTGATSGAAFDTEAAYLVTISDGRMTREEDFRSHQEAHEAVGLSE